MASKNNKLTAQEKKFIDAAEIGDLQKVTEYIREGVNIEAKDQYGSTALHKAAHNGYLEIVKLLVESGAQVDCLDKARYSPLMTACYNGQIDVVDYLLSKGAKVTNSLLMGIQQKVDILKENAQIGMVRPDAVDTWLWFLKYLQIAQIKQLKPITNDNKSFENQLINAAFEGNFELLENAIANGADVNATDKQEISALRWAVIGGYLSIVRVLVEAGAKINKGNSYGWTAIVDAVFAQNFDMVELLIELGADVNAKTSYNASVLYFAKEMMNFSKDTQNTQKIIDLLEQKGAQISYPEESF